MTPKSLPWLLLAGLAACEPAEPTPTVVLPLGTDTLPTTYGSITQGVWLGGDRWAVLAPNANEVALVNFGTGDVSRLDTGSVIQNPYMLFADQDTLYVADWGRRRLTVWGPPTGPGSTSPLLDSVPAPNLTRGALPQAVDAAGQFYVELAPDPGPNGSGNRDSAAVVRLSPDLSSGDTVAQLTPLDVAEVQADAGRRFERRVFSGEDAWGVLPDGTIWIARVNQNRVVWVSPRGEMRRGELLPDRVLEVTRIDRERFIRQFPEELRSNAERLPFAPLKPPFETGFTDALGRVWLEKSRAIADTMRRYQVVDRQGRLIREVHLPGFGRILDVGDSTALVVEPTGQGARLVEVPVNAGNGVNGEGERREG